MWGDLCPLWVSSSCLQSTLLSPASSSGGDSVNIASLLTEKAKGHWRKPEIPNLAALSQTETRQDIQLAHSWKDLVFCHCRRLSREFHWHSGVTFFVMFIKSCRWNLAIWANTLESWCLFVISGMKNHQELLYCPQGTITPSEVESALGNLRYFF